METQYSICFTIVLFLIRRFHREILKGEEITNVNSKKTIYCIGAATVSIQMDIIYAIAEAETYDWIKENHFKGSFKDTRMVIGQEKYIIRLLIRRS